MKEYKVGEKINIQLEVVEQYISCEGCFFFNVERCKCSIRRGLKFECRSLIRSDGKGIIFKEIKK